MSPHAVTGQKRKAEMKGCLIRVTSRDLDEGRHFRWRGGSCPRRAGETLSCFRERPCWREERQGCRGKKDRLMIVKYPQH